MKMWGCNAYVYVPQEKRRAWTKKSIKMKFVGYQEGTRNYRFVDRDGHITRSSNAVFIEQDKNRITSNKPMRDEEIDDKTPPPLEDKESNEEEIEDESEESGNEEEEQQSTVEREVASPRRTGRTRKLVDHGPMVAHRAQERAFVATISELPKSVDEALIEGTWKSAMDDEYCSLIGRGTWEVVDRPRDRKVVSSKWVYALKTNELGQVVRAKARFVAKGFSQVPGVDFNESYAPVSDPAVMRVFMAHAAKKGLKMKSFDFKCAFLNGTLQEEIYLEQPQGYVVGDPKKKVLLLRKAIYGLVQAALEWRRVLVKALEELNFAPLVTDPASFIRKKDGVMLNTHVDDVTAYGEDAALEELGDGLEKKFDLNRLGETSYVVGVRIEREGDKVYLSQTAYIEKLLKRYNLESTNEQPTPMAEGGEVEEE